MEAMGDGGGGGAVTITMDSLSSVISLTNIGAAFQVSSPGGNGGYGAAAPSCCYYSGNAGNGANAGTINMEMAAGSMISSNALGANGNPGVPALTLSAPGGQGGSVGNSDGFFSVDASTGGHGGAGGSISAGQSKPILLSGDITSTGSGILATSSGGSGGNGGIAYAGGRARGGPGGAGGYGSDVLLNFGYGASISAQGATQVATGTTFTLTTTDPSEYSPRPG